MPKVWVCTQFSSYRKWNFYFKKNCMFWCILIDFEVCNTQIYYWLNFVLGYKVFHEGLNPIRGLQPTTHCADSFLVVWHVETMLNCCKYWFGTVAKVYSFHSRRCSHTIQLLIVMYIITVVVIVLSLLNKSYLIFFFFLIVVIEVRLELKWAWSDGCVDLP